MSDAEPSRPVFGKKTTLGRENQKTIVNTDISPAYHP
jgi:hypothetical protein